MSEWFYRDNVAEHGPVNEDGLRALVETGLLRPDDFVRRDDLPNWIAAWKLTGLFSTRREEADMGDRRSGRYRRIGNTTKCPACGVTTDPGAYRCPRCLIYFCFKCRRRVQQRDPQFQCVNQQCEQYGKMLCNGCVVTTPVMSNKTYQELASGDKHERILSNGAAGALAFCGWLLAFLLGITIGLPDMWSLILGLVLAGLLYNWLSEQYVYQPPVYRTGVKEVLTGHHKCCIACRQPVQQL